MTLLHDDLVMWSFLLAKGVPNTKAVKWVLEETGSSETGSLTLAENAAATQMLVGTITPLIVLTAAFICTSW